MSDSALGASDIFYFNSNIGDFGNQNYVMDFQQDMDLIDLVAAEGLSLSDLTITTVDSTQILGGTDTQIYVTGDAANVVTLVGFDNTVTPLTQDDFVNLMA
jgi:hypothetical protein